MINEELALLLLRLKAGDHDAFRAIFLAYSGKVYNFAYKLLHDKSLASDIVQFSFLKVWERREGISVDTNFEAYIFVIARHEVFKETERLIRHIEALTQFEQDAIAEEDVLGDTIDDEYIRCVVNDAIEKLPVSRKEILKLRKELHLSNAEIAGRLNISHKTVETQISRSIKFIRDQVKHLLQITL